MVDTTAAAEVVAMSEPEVTKSLGSHPAGRGYKSSLQAIQLRSQFRALRCCLSGEKYLGVAVVTWDPSQAFDVSLHPLCHSRLGHLAHPCRKEYRRGHSHRCLRVAMACLCPLLLFPALVHSGQADALWLGVRLPQSKGRDTATERLEPALASALGPLLPFLACHPLSEILRPASIDPVTDQGRMAKGSLGLVSALSKHHRPSERWSCCWDQYLVSLRTGLVVRILLASQIQLWPLASPAPYASYPPR